MLEIGKDAGRGAESTGDAGLDRGEARGRGRFNQGHVAHGRGQSVNSGSRPGELVHVLRVVRVHPLLVFVVDCLSGVDAEDSCVSTLSSILFQD